MCGQSLHHVQWPPHREIWTYYQCTGRVHGKALQDLTVQKAMPGAWHVTQACCHCSGTKSGGLIALAMLVGAPVIEFGIIQELGWWHYPQADKLFGLVGLPSWYGHGGVVPWYTAPPSPARPHLLVTSVYVQM